MRRIFYYLLLAVCLLFSSLWIIAHTFHASPSIGYREIDPVMQQFVVPGKVTLTEFFSYGCPACYMIEPELEKWLSQHQYVVFQRVPSIFRSEWEIYAKAYYVAKHFGISEEITPSLFKAIHDKGKELLTPDQMATFFVKYGVSKKQFEEVFNFAPVIDGQVSRADKLFHQYQIFAIPTFVINGKYLTNADMTDGSNPKLFEILETLTNPQFSANEKTHS